MLPDLETLGALAVYALVGGLVFVESGLLVGFFLPGDTVLFTAGLLSADPSSGISVTVLTAVVLVTAVAGDATGFLIGRRAGPAVLDGRDNRVVNEANLERARQFTQRYGALSVVAARWIPWVRTFAPLLAGAMGMPYRRFLAANLVGALSWGAGLVVLGHLAGRTPQLKIAAYVVAGVFVAGSFVTGAVRAYRLRTARGR